jgi:hypothetical protein
MSSGFPVVWAITLTKHELNMALRPNISVGLIEGSIMAYFSITCNFSCGGLRQGEKYGTFFK